MGSIASVLQWHCSKCSLINPTESASCARCGQLRREYDNNTNPQPASSSSSSSSRSINVKPKSEPSSEDSTPPTPPPRLNFTNQLKNGTKTTRLFLSKPSSFSLKNTTAISRWDNTSSLFTVFYCSVSYHVAQSVNKWISRYYTEKEALITRSHTREQLMLIVVWLDQCTRDYLCYVYEFERLDRVQKIHWIYSIVWVNITIITIILWSFSFSPDRLILWVK